MAKAMVMSEDAVFIQVLTNSGREPSRKSVYRPLTLFASRDVKKRTKYHLRTMSGGKFSWERDIA